DSAVLDGEAMRTRPDGRPHPFQVTGSRFGTRTPVESIPLTPMFFDVLHLDGEDLLDRPARERAQRPEVVPARVPRGSDGEAMLEAALAMGHEGVVVKALDAPYEAGRRGSAWVHAKSGH